MKEPSFWHETDRYSRRSAPVTRALLTPLSMLYRWAGQHRIDSTTPFHAGAPVICVGNLTVGGSGKTPIVAAIRDFFVQRGVRAVSLSRGYKGSHKGPLKVDMTAHTAADVGDEPLMLACSGEAWIGADREEAARAMVYEKVELIIMDDGHQNPTLHKDLSIVVVDGGNPVGNGFVFPKGPLREPISTGLSRADAVIIMGELKEDLPELDAFKGPVLRARLSPRGPAPDGKLVAFAGIGRPDKFFDSLAQAGADLEETMPFPDHHTYRKSDLSFLRKLAAERNARLITTEKDFVRLPEAERDGILAFPVETVFDGDALSALLAPLVRV
ncbi:MAG: tetraacyldisaccharide 4'-kinase [Ponticaulis sp.]|nr:tetraacyldisaccharide 4'-kinase [Ponticaulis sp.]|tara:strand:- start:2442 stop:3425 length:984 start_codon:yes stop_codon:yes gene_type:complete